VASLNINSLPSIDCVIFDNIQHLSSFSFSAGL